MPVPSKPKIAYVVSAPTTIRSFLLPQIKALTKSHDVTVVANIDEQSDIKSWLPETVHVKHIPIQRESNIFCDVNALFKLITFFGSGNFSLVHSVTPKAGLLSMAASWVTRVPIRLHTFTGQIWATRQGLTRSALRFLDKLIDRFATKVLVDSHSQRDFLLKNNVVTIDSSAVLGEGSISGVDTDRFKSNDAARKKIRQELGITGSTVLMLFVGRLKKEKGIFELAEAFRRIHRDTPDTALCIVGPDEEEIRPALEHDQAIYLVPYTAMPEHYMAAADIFCAPSYREGFGSVVIEAGACGIPTIGSNIYGLSDAVADGVTGILVPPKSASGLQRAIQLLIEDAPLRRKMGLAARSHAVTKFSQARITEELLTLYKKLLKLHASTRYTHSEQ